MSINPKETNVQNSGEQKSMVYLGNFENFGKAV